MKKVVITVLIPIIVLLGWTLRLRYLGVSGVEVELPVTGYDPVDPLSGHYVTYRLALGRNDPCLHTNGKVIDRSQEQCLCLDDNKGKREPGWAGPCSDRTGECSLYLKGVCPWTGFIVGIERFYIPEADSKWLGVVPPKSTVVLSLTGGGKALVKAFKPEGRDYAEWIKEKQQTSP